VTISKRAIPPKVFLPADTIVCAGTTVELKSTQIFNQYLWSNGSVMPVMETERAGLYLLQVKDRDGCTGVDSIFITHKNCTNKILFPSAFSPNDDNRNDVIRAFVQGRLMQYRFTIYNRWGQIVFQTTDHRKGWEGYFGGLLQGNSVFVWICNYQFAGEKIMMEKGILTLLK
jgi:gliding motility-associated-like protein